MTVALSIGLYGEGFEPEVCLGSPIKACSKLFFVDFPIISPPGL